MDFRLNLKMAALRVRQLHPQERPEELWLNDGNKLPLVSMPVDF